MLLSPKNISRLFLTHTKYAKEILICATMSCYKFEIMDEINKKLKRKNYQKLPN